MTGFSNLQAARHMYQQLYRPKDFIVGSLGSLHVMPNQYGFHRGHFQL